MQQCFQTMHSVEPDQTGLESGFAWPKYLEFLWYLKFWSIRKMLSISDT